VAETVPKTTDKTSGGSRPRLMLMDGHSLAYRAFFALPAENFTTAQGQPTNAIYGFASMLANTLRDEAPTHFAVAFDVSRKTWRSEEFTEYKANRSTSPDEFKGQVELIGELLDAMHAERFAVDGYEADDIIATLATRAEAEGFDVLIVTGDRDSFQLVTEHTTVLYPTKGVSELTRFTPEKVVEKYGLTPAQYPDFAALRGDPSDNLPGIPGVGEKTAAKWINQFGSFTDLVERVDEVKGKAGQNLRDHLESVKLNRRLTELVRTVELPRTVADLERAAYDRKAVALVLDTLEIRNPSLRERLLAVDPGTEEAESTPAAADGVEIDGTVLGTGELSGWLAGTTAAPSAWPRSTPGRWAPDRWPRSRWPQAGDRLPGSTRPSWTRPTRTRSRPGWPTPAGPRSCTTPRAPCVSSPSTAGASTASPWTPRSPPTWSNPDAAPSTSTRCRWSTSAANWAPPPRPTASSPSVRTTTARPRR
jgi:DNA polymerase-1